jgi:hypothetical protein
MSNTGSNKKLASFNCDEELWSSFVSRCRKQGTTATTILTRFIQLYRDGKLDNLDVAPRDSRFDERVRASVDEYLTTHPLQNQISALSEKIANLEGQLSANLTRTNTKPTTFKKEREFWFIQERAKYLGLSVNAAQRLKIEMFTNDAYQQRHGTLPKRQLFRGYQAFAYPAEDLDILDATIRGVVKGG